MKSKGQIGYEAYGETAGWKTFDGRPMPTWEQLQESETGRETCRRWEVSATAICSSDSDLPEVLTVYRNHHGGHEIRSADGSVSWGTTLEQTISSVATVLRRDMRPPPPFPGAVWDDFANDWRAPPGTHGKAIGNTGNA